MRRSDPGAPEWATSQFEDGGTPQPVVLQGTPNVDSKSPKRERIFVEASKTHHGIYPETNAIIALVLSIVGLMFLGPCTAIPAVILSTAAIKITSQYPGHPDHGVARAAQIIGWIAIVLTVLAILFFVFVFGFAVIWSI